MSLFTKCSMEELYREAMQSQQVGSFHNENVIRLEKPQHGSALPKSEDSIAHSTFDVKTGGANVKVDLTENTLANVGGSGTSAKITEANWEFNATAILGDAAKSAMRIDQKANTTSNQQQIDSFEAIKPCLDGDTQSVVSGCGMSASEDEDEECDEDEEESSCFDYAAEENDEDVTCEDNVSLLDEETSCLDDEIDEDFDDEFDEYHKDTKVDRKLRFEGFVFQPIVRSARVG